MQRNSKIDIIRLEKYIKVCAKLMLSPRDAVRRVSTRFKQARTASSLVRYAKAAFIRLTTDQSYRNRLKCGSASDAGTSWSMGLWTSPVRSVPICGA